ncbi:hypothetical protein [Pseudomonas promysalinigenes]|uniref:hypothetical protein n=1 Tax=Pseudomonas promysalinigenes TaxID=485898 RepID=UPI003F9F6822
MKSLAYQHREFPSVERLRTGYMFMPSQLGYSLPRVYVLPFTDLPDELDRERDVLCDLSGEVVEFEMGCDGCPSIQRISPKLDQAFQY